MAKVSVIIPNYNRAAIVGETIENMLHQSLPPYEVIVVDDGSTDSSVEVIRSFGDRVTLIQQSNQGPGAARNAGLRVASGQFIQLMDSDDLASLNKLEVQAESLFLHKADIVYSPWVRVFLQGMKIKLQDVVLQQRLLPTTTTVLQHFLTGWSIVLQQCLFRTSFLRKVGLYRTDMHNWEDGELFLRMLMIQPKIVFSNVPLTLYRLDDYGKLTGSGKQNISRIEDCSRFLIAAYEKSQQQTWSQPAVAHPTFLSDVWKTLSLLEKSNSPNQLLISQMREILKSRKTKINLRLYARLTEVRKGVQQRTRGHRWSSAYQSGSLNFHQKKLISELQLKID